MRVLFRLAVLAAIVASDWATGHAQTAPVIDYDTFCKVTDIDAKRSAFLATTAENRGVLVRTHIERWRDANKARLNEKQLTFLTDLMASITPDTYADGPKGDEARVKARPLVEQTRQHFSNEDNQAMQPFGPCIAKDQIGFELTRRSSGLARPQSNTP